jgi:methylenetetrahydrofolate reductase (NADPH)
MKVGDAYGPGKFGLSFELFPPKTPEGEAELYRQLAELMVFRPSYVTCTYGAGGSTRAKTLAIVCEVRRRHGCPVASHLTCVEATVDELRSYLRQASEGGVQNIVALRGDPPRGAAGFQAKAGGLRYANELVALIRAEFPQFGIAVAGYPETHQEAPSPAADLQNLKRKVDAGADVVITQLFYDNADFFRFREACGKLGVPIVPGILPVTNLAQVQRITNLCKARLPEGLVGRLEAFGGDADAQIRAGIEFAIAQVSGLLEAGVPGIHFYVLNRSHATASILRAVQAKAV